MEYFDCCCEIGPRNEKDPAAPWSAEDVLRWMDRCGIAAALVVHTLSVHGNCVQSRARLRAEVARAPDRLLPVWTIVPPDAGDVEATAPQLLQAMSSEGVRAVKLFPKTHNYPLSVAVTGPMLRALQAGHVLTMIDFAELPAGADGAFSALGAILEGFPELPVLLERIPWSMQRVVTALLARHESLHVEFSTYQINRGLERYVERFGAERLLFGTGLPAMSAGAARAYVDYAEVSHEAKTGIAGGNLRRLLGNVRIGRPAPAGDDALVALAGEGRPLTDFAPIDAHCHVLHEGTHGAGGYVMYDGDAEGVLALNERMGLQAGTIISWTGPIASDPIDGNDVVARALATHPGKFYGLIYVNPAHLDAPELTGEIRKRLAQPGWIGLKPYHRTGLPYDDLLYGPCWRIADESGLMVLLHLGGKAGTAATAAVLAAKHPHAQWVIAHSGGSFEMARGVAPVMKDHPNVWAELTLTPVTNGVIEWLVGQVGDDRILFGTDAPMRDPRPQLGWVVWADLTVESRRRILGDNFRRLLSVRKER